MDEQRRNYLFSRRWRRPLLDVTDRELVDTMVEHGFPRHDAFIQFKASLPRQYAMLREMALRFYVDVIDARRGDPEAQERVDYCREAWATMNAERRAAERIAP